MLAMGQSSKVILIKIKNSWEVLHGWGLGRFENEITESNHYCDIECGEQRKPSWVFKWLKYKLQTETESVSIEKTKQNKNTTGTKQGWWVRKK